MAEGGEATTFCASNKPHDPSCEHHSDPKADSSAVLTTGANALFAGNPKYQKDVKRGHKAIKSHVDDLFDSGTSKVIKPDMEARDRLHKYVAAGGLNNEVQSREIVTNPEIPSVQNTMLNATKGNAYNYLNNLRPVPTQFQSKLAFDDVTHDKEAERTYHRALDVANDPLGVLRHIKSGTLLPEHISHIKGMYPDLNDHLQQKLTEKITKAQINEQKPTYKTRMGLSVFMGAHLDSTLTPANMQAAQATFAPQQAAAQPPAPKGGGSKKSLSKVADEYKTGDQAAATRAQQ